MQPSREPEQVKTGTGTIIYFGKAPRSVNQSVKSAPKTIQTFEELDNLFTDLKTAKDKELKMKGSADETKNAIKVLGGLKGNKEAELNALNTLSETNPSNISKLDEMLTILRHSEFPEVRREMMRLRIKGLAFRKGELKDPVAKLSHLNKDELNEAEDLYHEIETLRNACPAPSKKEEWTTKLNELEKSLTTKRDAANANHTKELIKNQAMETALIHFEQPEKNRRYEAAFSKLTHLLKRTTIFTDTSPHRRMAASLMKSGREHFRKLYSNDKSIDMSRFQHLTSTDNNSWFSKTQGGVKLPSIKGKRNLSKLFSVPEGSEDISFINVYLLPELDEFLSEYWDSKLFEYIREKEEHKKKLTHQETRITEARRKFYPVNDLLLELHTIRSNCDKVTTSKDREKIESSLLKRISIQHLKQTGDKYKEEQPKPAAVEAEIHALEGKVHR